MAAPTEPRRRDAPRLTLIAVAGLVLGGALAIPFSGQDGPRAAGTVVLDTSAAPDTVSGPSGTGSGDGGSAVTDPAEPSVTDPPPAGPGTDAVTTTTAGSTASSSLGTAPPTTVDATASATAPDVDAKAYVVFDATSGTRLASKDAASPMPVGSLMKLVTAYVVLDGGAMEQRVTVPSIPFDHTVQMIGLTAGETFERATLFRAMLIYSAADAAYALALDRSGTEEAFAAEMNAAAARLGLSATRARNATGLDASGQVSTADDMLTLTRVLMTDDTFRAAVAKRTANMHGKAFANTNDLLRTYIGADGVKTGSTTQAGSCLVASATRDGRSIIVVVLGAPTDEARFASATKLLDWAFGT